MRRPLSTAARLRSTPHRFGFDAALRVLMRAARTHDPADAARFSSDADLGFPGGEVSAVESEGRKPRVMLSLIGLTGASGVLPRLYGQTAVTSARRGSTALAGFLDLLSHRMVAFFGWAGIKYRLHRQAEQAALSAPVVREPAARVLLALTGHGTPGLAERVAAGTEPLLHYAGLFATRPRSAERLAALVSDWLGHPVQVRQFAGAWLSLPEDQRTVLPAAGSAGAWNRLGVDAAIGVQSWDIQGQIVLRIGPLGRADFEALLPGRPVYMRLVSLVRAFLGLETGFAVNPVVARDAAFPLCLNGDGSAMLGWNTWVTAPGRAFTTDAADAVFQGE